MKSDESILLFCMTIILADIYNNARLFGALLLYFVQRNSRIKTTKFRALAYGVVECRSPRARNVTSPLK